MLGRVQLFLIQETLKYFALPSSSLHPFLVHSGSCFCFAPIMTQQYICFHLKFWHSKPKLWTCNESNMKKIIPLFARFFPLSITCEWKEIFSLNGYKSADLYVVFKANQIWIAANLWNNNFVYLGNYWNTKLCYIY